MPFINDNLDSQNTQMFFHTGPALQNMSTEGLPCGYNVRDRSTRIYFCPGQK